MVQAARNIALGGSHDVDLSVFRGRRVALAVGLAFGIGFPGDDAGAAEPGGSDIGPQAGGEPVMIVASRATTEHMLGVFDVLRWMGLDWDEGPDVGGPHGP